MINFTIGCAIGLVVVGIGNCVFNHGRLYERISIAAKHPEIFEGLFLRT